MVFHITIISSEKSVFPSISSDSLVQSPGGVTLGDIRNRINLPKKLLFTADGKSSLEDGTKLDYYMSLTAQVADSVEKGEDERNKQGDSQVTPTEEPAKHEQAEGSKDTKKDSAKIKNPEQDSKKAKNPKRDNTKIENPEENGKDSRSGTIIPKLEKQQPVQQVNVKVIMKGEKVKSDRKLLDLPENLLAKLKDTSPEFKFGDSAINAVKLLNEFEALKIQATTADGEINHPYHFTEVQWDELMANNRALHGYVMNKDKKTFKKASKPAFRFRQQAQNQLKPSTNKTPGIPSFAINDDSHINIVEVQTAFEKRLATHGFNSDEIEGSLGVKECFGISVGHNNATQERADDIQRGVKSLLYTTYNFPRVTVDLSPDTLELTDELKWDIQHASKADEEALHAAYGARLESVRVTEAEEQSKVSEIKNSLRAAAGASFQSPWVSGQAQGIHQHKDASQDSGSHAMKDYKVWRIIEQGEPVLLFKHIAEVDSLIGHILEVGLPQQNNPSPVSSEKMKSFRAEIVKGDGQPIVKRIRALFEATSFSMEDYNSTKKKLGVDASMVEIETKAWGAMNDVQKSSLAYYFAYKGLLS
ncbi:membrane attack complex component perforin [Fusarium heterosporum]|uniref:Membrane attack complex component perforin n=1 Tax=Fusarium heterosporum TaxID=42747 RepID=A0A8H5T412_FUSHE|nr:membrane attack complex component perforin [Fusarium heterosporum]